MSKKKSSTTTTTTMSLKDFHGGCIPSDLLLPSAPASSSSAPTRWGPSQIRPEPFHRARPVSAGSSSSSIAAGGVRRLIDERDPPLLSTTNIGRNFDEEERKPFEASSSFPHRIPLSDPVPRSVAPVIGSSRSDPKPSQPPQPQVRSAVGPNAWGTKKEEVKHLQDPTMESSMVVEDLSARFAQASAIKKVSSGRWQSKRPVTPPTLVLANGEVIRARETGRVLEEEAKEIRPGLDEGKPSEVKELGEEWPRPKLLLGTRSAVDLNDVTGLDEKQGYQPTIDPIRSENPCELQGSLNLLRPGSAGENVGGQLSERRRLNLKPRSLPAEQALESVGRERKSVFGGARPRELVLKERGIDDVIGAHLDVPSPANRNKSDTPKIETKTKLDAPTVANRCPESYSIVQRSGRDFERKDIRSDHGKVHAQGASWRNDNRKNTRETGKLAQRCSEPDTWRKPVEQPKSEAPSGPRVGKVASPLELAQAFSRSGSDVRMNRVQIPFSRLTNTRDFYVGPNPRQINGY